MRLLVASQVSGVLNPLASTSRNAPNPIMVEGVRAISMPFARGGKYSSEAVVTVFRVVILSRAGFRR